ncbi:MAG: FAD-dependent oxidoreductase, partial [Methanosarcinales archaeon]|nr:FAD-dependent oxidoreductase [Methanosarcinales archaeon]
MVYDVIIIGGGPAGLSAGIYAKRAMMNALLIEKVGVGGQIIKTHMLENYPGFPEVSGME